MFFLLPNPTDFLKQGGLQTQGPRELAWRGKAPAHLDLDLHPWFEVLWDVDGVSFPPRESQGVRRLPREVLEGDHSHSDQVTAVDALVALRQDRLDSLRAKRGVWTQAQSFLRHRNLAKGFPSQNSSHTDILYKSEVIVYTKSYPLAINSTAVRAQ